MTAGGGSRGPAAGEVPRARARGLSGLALLVAALAGASTMVVELSAVRLLAPWFGTSAGVWTNVIGVILFALALGYLAGGRLSARPRPLSSLALVLLLAAVAVAWLPALARPVAGWFLPGGLRLHQTADAWLWGSLAATLVLFVAPAALLGCAGPLLVEVVHRRERASAGAAGGLVLCASTLGSLAGTFATTHALVPRLGLSATLLGAGGVLLLLGLVALGVAFAREPRRGLFAALPALVAVAAAAGLARLRAPQPADGLRLLEARESPYQALRVVEDPSWPGGLRMLQVDEGLDSFQSVWVPQPGLIGTGFYYDYFALPAWWARRAGPWRVLVLGLGAGTAFRVLEGASPPRLELDLWGVELDRDVVELGRRWFDLDERWRVLAGQDARAALRALPRDFDLIVLDAYAHQVEIPAHLATVELFREAREHLAPGGWIAVNVGGFGADDPVVDAVGGTLATAFGARALGVRVPRSRNWVLFAREGAPLPAPGEPGWEVPGAVGEALLPPLEVPGAVAWFEPRARAPLTDDKSPLDALQRRSLEQARERLAAGGA